MARTCVSTNLTRMAGKRKLRYFGDTDVDKYDQEQQSERSTEENSQKIATSALLPICYGIVNLVSVIAIVVANKHILHTYRFRYPVTLTCLHAIVTACSLKSMAVAGMFQPRSTPFVKAAPTAIVYVLFIILNNKSLQMNTVGFYQIAKVAVTPMVIAIEFIWYKKTISRHVAAATSLLIIGVALCTVTERKVGASPAGVLVAISSVTMSGLYQVWAGIKQKELELSGLQLLNAVLPIAGVLLAFMIPIFEPVGLFEPKSDSILGYSMTKATAIWIVISCVLGVMVTMTTFLFIGATSSLTYNVVGHLKLLGIVAAGMFLFGDSTEPRKSVGMMMSVAGIAWYSYLKIKENAKACGSLGTK